MEYVLDGPVLNKRFDGLLRQTPSVDAVNEIRVETSVASAKNCRPGTIILARRSGANTVHGSLTCTGTNNGFGVARSNEQIAADGKNPVMSRNEFDGRRN